VGAAGASPFERWPFVARDPEVALLDDLLLSGRGAVIIGDAGVGKSRLLATIGERAESLGWQVTRVAASRALASVPFGAFAAVLGSSMSNGGGDLFSILQEALAELGGSQDRPVLVAIDDAHQLDEGGAALAALAARSGLVVMASVRRGERCPDPVTSLWKDDLAARVDLTPLDGVGVAAVLRAALGAPVDSGTRHRLAEKTGGNLLFLRELVRVGLDRGSLVERGDVWMWDGAISEAPAVADLVRSRLAGLSAVERHVVDVVAMAEPIGLSVLDSLCDPSAVRECVADGILVTQRSGRRLEARLDHPLYAEAVRDAMTAITSTELAKALADEILESGARRVGDRLRAATLLLLTASPIELGLLLTASAEARSLADLELAERFGRAAVEAHGCAGATVDLAQTLYWRGRHGEVVALLSSGVLDDADEDDAGRGATIAAQAHFFGLGDLQAAERWIAAGVDRGGSRWAALLRGKHSQMLMNAGRSRDAIAEGRAVLADSGARPVAHIAAYSGLLPALAVGGQLSELSEHLPVAQRLIADAPDGFTDNADGTLVAMFIGGLFEGTLPKIDPVFEAFDEDALRRIDDPFRCIWVFLRGRSALAQGRLGIALPTLREAAAVLRRRDPGGMLGWCLASLAQVCGATGDAKGARAAVAEFDEVHPAVMRNIDVEIGLGRAWAAAAEGNRSDASDIAMSTAAAMLERGDDAVGIFALHDAVRLGASPRIVERALEEPMCRAEGPVVAAMNRHVQALARADVEGLCHVADEFVAVSMRLLAAEACAVASRLAAANGLRTRQRDASTRAAALLADCGPALTPMLETLIGREALTSLTRREQEVALMAARGTSKRIMSEQLGVSIRTVGNHINHVYGKLGISTREELAALLSLGSQT
jgi:DNA-binding CsgD family transcriptional regulator